MDRQNRKHPSLPDHHPENQEEMLLSPQNHHRLLRKKRLLLQNSIHFPVKTPIKKSVPGKFLLLYKYIVLSFPDPSLRSMQWQQLQLRYLCCITCGCFAFCCRICCCPAYLCITFRCPVIPDLILVIFLFFINIFGQLHFMDRSKFLC